MSPSEEQIETIRAKAEKFAERWQGRDGKHRPTEEKDSQTFINEFFAIFGIDRLASNIVFEYKLLNNDKKIKKIDALWHCVVLIESKSPDSNKVAAKEQAIEYYNMIDSIHKPELIFTHDFYTFNVYSPKENNREIASFELWQLPKNIDLFHYFLEHKHEQIVASEVVIERPMIKTVKEIVEKPVEKIVRRPGYWILALACIASFMLGHTISDRQRETYRESVIEESTRR